MDKKDLKDHISVKESLANARARILEALDVIKEWITDYGKVILPLILLGCVIITIIISLFAREKVEAAKIAAQEALEEVKEEILEVKETPFEVDAYPEINSLVVSYYEALAAGDLEALEMVRSNITEPESLRLQAMGPYIDHYENIVVYTKPGPYLDTYIVYVYVDLVLVNMDEATPGLSAFYVRMNEDGEYYIYNGELNADEASYIEGIAGQADVIDLKNTVNVAYGNIMAENENLKNYWAKMSMAIDDEVGDRLAEEAAQQALLEAQDVSDNDETLEEDEPKIIQVRVNTLVNVRKSASATADKLGMASQGTVYDVIEIMANGWTMIRYEGGQGYIKTEFLDPIEDLSNVETNGTVKADVLVNIRADGSTTGMKLGVLNVGEELPFIEEADGWCKVLYDGQTAYVSSEFVTINEAK